MSVAVIHEMQAENFGGQALTERKRRGPSLSRAYGSKSSSSRFNTIQDVWYSPGSVKISTGSRKRKLGRIVDWFSGGATAQ